MIILGHGDAATVFLPYRVAALEKIEIQSISCGQSHMAALSSKGKFYCSIFRIKLI